MTDLHTSKIDLQVLIATYGKAGMERLARSALAGALPPTAGVSYLISCQTGRRVDSMAISPSDPGLPATSTSGPDGFVIPESLLRDDIEVLFTPTAGLSRNRNILLAGATSPLCLIADDDLSYTSASLRDVIKTFKENPDIDIATFISANAPSDNNADPPSDNNEESLHSGRKEPLRYEKRYPGYSFDLRKPAKGYYITSFEIAFRRESVIGSGILFNENFGVGAPIYGAGEEELWVNRLLRSGLRGRFFPRHLTVHHGPTTGTREAANPRVLRAQGVIIPLLYPATGLPRLFLKAYRSAKASGAGFGHCLRHILLGYSDLLFHKNRILTSASK